MVNAPDFLTAYYAAVCSIRDGELSSIELSHTVETDEAVTTLTMTLYKDVLTDEATTETSAG